MAIPNVSKGVRQLKVSYVLSICTYVTAQWFSFFVNLCQFFINQLGMYLPYDMRIPLLSIYVKNVKEHIYKNIHSQIFQYFIHNNLRQGTIFNQFIAESINKFIELMSHPKHFIFQSMHIFLYLFSISKFLSAIFYRI